jgi:hypothetical protein
MDKIKIQQPWGKYRADPEKGLNGARRRSRNGCQNAYAARRYARNYSDLAKAHLGQLPSQKSILASHRNHYTFHRQHIYPYMEQIDAMRVASTDCEAGRRYQKRAAPCEQGQR